MDTTERLENLNASGQGLAILLSGQREARVVSQFLVAAGAADGVLFFTGQENAPIKDIMAATRGKSIHRIINVKDSDEIKLPSRKHVSRWDEEDVIFIECYAVPSVCAWAFADRDLLMSVVDADVARKLISRLPLPEQIFYPERIWNDLEFDRKLVDVLASVDIFVAAALSPSLRLFLEAVFEALGRPMPEIKDAYSRNLNRDIIANLMAEVSQPDMPVYRAADGATYTAEQMIRHIREGSPIGQQYASDLLRVSRDMLARQARRAG